jgi:hypothetical protein
MYIGGNENGSQRSRLYAVDWIHVDQGRCHRRTILSRGVKFRIS